MSNVRIRAMGADVRLGLHQMAAEQREFWRSGARARFTFALPIGLLVLLGTVNRSQTVDVDGGISYGIFLVPGMVAFAVITGTFVAISANLTVLREAGVLKRLRTTPLPIRTFLAAKLASSLLNVLLLFAGILVAGAVLFDAPLRAAGLPAAIVAVILGSATFFALGVAATRLMRTPDSSVVVANALLLPMAFVSGVFSPRPDGGAGRVAALLPLEPVVRLLHLAITTDDTRALVSWSAVGVLIVWLVIGVLSASRYMCWLPLPARSRSRRHVLTSVLQRRSSRSKVA